MLIIFSSFCRREGTRPDELVGEAVGGNAMAPSLYSPEPRVDKCGKHRQAPDH